MVPIAPIALRVPMRTGRMCSSIKLTITTMSLVHWYVVAARILNMLKYISYLILNRGWSILFKIQSSDHCSTMRIFLLQLTEAVQVITGRVGTLKLRLFMYAN
jgi:hypothetical protein